MQTQPPRSALEDVRKDALLVHLAGVDLVVQQIGAVGHGDVAQHAHGDHLLIEMDGLVLAGDQLRQLLIAGGDVAAGGNIHKQGR